MAKSSQHVVPSAKNTWSVRRSGSVKASRVFNNKLDAERYAKDVGKNQHMDVYIHRKDGMIEKKITISTYSNTARNSNTKNTTKSSAQSSSTTSNSSSKSVPKSKTKRSE